WELCKLSSLMSFSNGINAPKENYGKGRKMISVMDILDEHPVKYEYIRNSVQVNEEIESKNKVEYGDLVFVRSSEVPEEVGWAKAYLEEEYALYSGFSIRGKKTNEFNSHFVELTLNSINRKQIERKAGGSTRFNVSQTILNSLELLVPKIEEQNKISYLFKKLDDTIALHQRKLDQLKELKKAYLQVMFVSMNTKNNKVPKLRFANFEGNWEQCKLIDLATTYIGLVTTMTTNYTDQGTLLIRNSDIKEGKFDLNNPIYLKEEFAKQNENRSMKMGDVVTVHTGDIGTSAVITEDLDGTIGFATITTRPSKKLNSNYLCWYFNSNIHKKYAKRMSTGDGRSNYNMKDFNKNILVIPKIEEQQTIGIFFQNLDNTITLHQNKLDQLKSLKKSYLQNMFI
ncbi:restriction endonuclease subunit S, partial [Enterococcus faecalis]|uniref:restriction endonuclease subunit S n=5 Tax=Enterococcus faecalis TaxID=1351 RepID=UPI0022E38125